MKKVFSEKEVTSAERRRFHGRYESTAIQYIYIYIYFLPWNSMQSLPSRLQALFHLKVKPKRQQLSCSALSHKKSLYSKAKRLQHIQHINLVGRSSIPFTFLILVVVVALN